MTVAGHSVDIIAVEGQYTKRMTAGSIAFYIGSRYDVILCADQVRIMYLRRVVCPSSIGYVT